MRRSLAAILLACACLLQAATATAAVTALTTDLGKAVDTAGISGARSSSSSTGRVDERCDHTVGKRFDQGAERQCHDQTDRDDDQFALHQEVFEASEHRTSCE
jgi:hypothetical protein